MQYIRAILDKISESFHEFNLLWKMSSATLKNNILIKWTQGHFYCIENFIAVAKNSIVKKFE